MRLTALFLTLFASTALAEEVIEYEFDMILFENLSASQAFLSDQSAREFINQSLEKQDAIKLAESTEQTEDAQAHNTEQGPKAYNSQDPAINFRELDTGALDDAVNTLNKSSAYRVISRKTWKQSGFSDGDSINLDIQAPHPDSDITTIALNAAKDEPYLSGSISFTFSRYIHLATDLVKHHDQENDLVGLPVLDLTDSTRIVLERKLKSRETHYIDHPLLGIVIDIKRVKKELSES